MSPGFNPRQPDSGACTAKYHAVLPPHEVTDHLSSWREAEDGASLIHGLGRGFCYEITGFFPSLCAEVFLLILIPVHVIIIKTVNNYMDCTILFFKKCIYLFGCARS